MAMWPFRRKEVEQRSLTSVPWAPMGGPPWAEGAPPPWAQGLDSETVLRCVPVFGAINFLANNIAAMAPGLGLYKLGKGDIAERQPTPSLFAAPSIHGTLFNWLHKSVISLAGGDAIGLITQRDYYGWPTMIEWLNPLNVVTLDRAIEGPGSYVDPRWYWWGRPMDPADLLHIPFFCLPWRVRGLSPLAAFARTAGINLGAEHFAKEWFENGGVPPGTFKNTTQKVLPDDADEIARRYTRRLRTRQPLIYGMDWEYTPIAISPNEAKFIETMQLTAGHVAVIYGVPPHKIGGLTGDSLTYSSVEQESMDVLNFTFRPWLVRYEYAFSTCFPRGYYVQFNTSEFIRIDAKTRAEIDNISLGFQNTGWKDADEVRASYNLAPKTIRPAPHLAGMPGAPGGNGAGPQSPNGHMPPPGGLPTPGTSAAAAEPITRSRWITNGHEHATTSA